MVNGLLKKYGYILAVGLGVLVYLFMFVKRKDEPNQNEFSLFGWVVDYTLLLNPLTATLKIWGWI